MLAQENTLAPAADLISLKLAYKKSLDEYRMKEEQYSIALQQYYSLRTLASQEEAVKATRDVMLARVDTLLLYIQSLQTVLKTQQGVELSRRDNLLSQLDLLVETLKRHRSRTEIATDRITIENEAVFMESQQVLIQQQSYSALALIKIGLIQAALDQLSVAKTALDAYISTANVSETVRIEKQRGSEEITRTITSIQESISTAILTYDENQESTSDDGGFREIQTTLTKGYAGLTQSLEYVKELSQ